jgi:hypothetical protein
MRVLHLPDSPSSQMSILVRALREHGVEARGIVRGNHPYASAEGIRDYKIRGRRKNLVHRSMQRARWWVALIDGVRWADVIHWHFAWGMGYRDLDLKLISASGKAALVEFWGSDIRIQEIASIGNPYFNALPDSDARYRVSQSVSRMRQEKFARNGFSCLVPGPELLDYVQLDLYPSPYKSMAALFPSDFEPSYPDPKRPSLVIAHMPSNKTVKGTDAVLRAIEKLKTRHDFRFQLIHEESFDKALAMIRDCDIMLDQFIVGSYGMVSLEAMALGKPVLCYLKDPVLPRLPLDFPVINANQDNLADVLEELIVDGQRRNEVGRLSRAYIEKYHDANVIAGQLIEIYQDLLDNRVRLHGNR